jgi:hypothetical protein
MMILVFRRGMGDDPRMVQTHLCPEKEGVVSHADRPSRATPGVFGASVPPCVLPRERGREENIQTQAGAGGVRGGHAVPPRHERKKKIHTFYF